MYAGTVRKITIRDDGDRVAVSVSNTTRLAKSWYQNLCQVTESMP